MNPYKRPFTWRARLGYAAIIIGSWALLAMLSNCAPAQPGVPVTIVEPVCWNMTKQWHFKDGCNVHSAWRYQVEI